MKQNKKKIIFGVLFISVILIILVISFINDRQNNKEMSDLEKEIENIMISKNNLENQIKKLKSKEKEFLDFNCEYIETYYFIEEYDFVGPIPESKYIIMNKFQDFSPIIIEINKNNFPIDFIENKNYEITFRSSIIDGKRFQNMITKINPTDKIGLDQIQESCNFENKKE